MPLDDHRPPCTATTQPATSSTIFAACSENWASGLLVLIMTSSFDTAWSAYDMRPHRLLLAGWAVRPAHAASCRSTVAQMAPHYIKGRHASRRAPGADAGRLVLPAGGLSYRPAALG